MHSQYTSSTMAACMTRFTKCFAVVTLLASLISLTSSRSLDDRPIFGVLLETISSSVNSTCSDNEPYYVLSDYKSFLEQAGAGVIPIFINQSDSYYERLMTRINGLVVPGGDANLITSPYGVAAYKLFKIATRMNDAGKYFPIFGICLGFQEMTTWPLSSRKDILSNSTGTEDVSLPLNFTKDAQTSRLFNHIPTYLLKALAKEKLTPNFHHFALSTKTYYNTKELTDYYKVTSTNTDVKALKFVSTMEARNYPFYAVQWHPEKISYFFLPNSRINHSSNAVLVGQYLSDFLITEARKSVNSFKSHKELARFLFNSFQERFNQVYMISYYCFNNSMVPPFESDNI